MDDKNRKCENCYHWFNIIVEKKKTVNGECRIFPPIVLVKGDSHGSFFPVIGNDKWCGDFFDKKNLLNMPHFG
tara:strand:- start:20085 stop:20303 length:219 start_codon:yes stop_codon:yes gene_type:complete